MRKTAFFKLVMGILCGWSCDWTVNALVSPHRLRALSIGSLPVEHGTPSRKTTPSAPRRHHRTTRLWSDQASPSSPTTTATPGSTVELIDPETGCQVVLLGCFHGSQSSADDVRTCLAVPTDVVVLELCASRFADLRRDMNPVPSATQHKLAWIVRFSTMIRKTIDAQGLSTGLATALLTGVSGMQTALSGLEPGLEFRTALLEVQRKGRTPGEKPCEIILADQNVNDTIQKIGQLPSLAGGMWKALLTDGWMKSFGIEAQTLARALGGGPPVRCPETGDVMLDHVHLWGFVTRSSAALRDLARLTASPILVLQGMLLAINHAYETSTWSEASTSVLDDSSMAPMWTGVLAFANYGVLMMAYLCIALPAAKVILRERDEILFEGMQEACRLATKNGTEPGRVCAVLGLLHVNGVAQHFFSAPDSSDP